MKIGGKQVKGSTVLLVAGGAGLAIFLYKRASSGSSAAGASSSAIDPVTGLPYSEDSTVDPATGMTYLAEAQQYGSVAAAEAAVAGQYSATGQAAGAGVTSGFPTIYGGGSQPSGNSYASNAQWSQAVTAGLVNLGYSATDVAAALGLYFQGMPLTSGADGVSYLSIIQAAVAEFGPPPVGTYPIVAPPTSGGGVGGTGSPGGGGTPPPPVAAGNIAVPELVGERANFAIGRLDSLGLKWVSTTGSRDPKHTYDVASQSPAAGTKVAKGSTVSLGFKQL